MAITAAELRLGVRNELFAAGVTQRPYETTLSTTVNSTVTTVSVADGDAWAVGDVGEFEDGELFLVTAISTNDLTVIRDYNGTTAASHTAGEIIAKNPRWTIQQIDQALDHVYQDLQPDVYDTHLVTFTKSSSTRWYDFDDTGEDKIFDVLGVYHKPDDEDHPRAINYWQFLTGLDATAFGAYSGLLLSSDTNITAGNSFYVITKKAITEAANVPDYLKSCVIFGACYQLLGSANAVRSHDPGKRTDRTVAPGQEARDSVWYWREYKRRKDDYAGELKINESLYAQGTKADRRARRFVG